MLHDEAEQALAAYVLDALPEAERRALEEHLRDCAECRQELAALYRAAAALPLTLDAAAPPPALRERILRAVGAAPAVPERRAGAAALFRRSAAGWLAAAALFLIALGLGGWAVAERQQLHQSVQTALTAPNGGASGRLIRQNGGPAVVYVQGLAPPPPGDLYEAWIVSGGGPPQPAGVFVSSPSGAGGLVLNHPITPGDQVLISRERAPGGQQPKGPVELQGKVG